MIPSIGPDGKARVQWGTAENADTGTSGAAPGAEPSTGTAGAGADSHHSLQQHHPSLTCPYRRTDPYTCPVGQALVSAIHERKGNQNHVRTA